MANPNYKKESQFTEIKGTLEEIKSGIKSIESKLAPPEKRKSLFIFILKGFGLLFLFGSWILQNRVVSYYSSLKYKHDLIADASYSLTTKADIGEFGVRIFRDKYKMNPDDSTTKVDYKTFLSQYYTDVHLNRILDYSALNLEPNKTFSDDSLNHYKVVYDLYIKQVDLLTKNANTKEEIAELEDSFYIGKKLRGDSIAGNINETIRTNRVSVMKREETWSEIFFWTYIIGSCLIGVAWVIEYWKN